MVTKYHYFYVIMLIRKLPENSLSASLPEQLKRSSFQSSGDIAIDGEKVAKKCIFFRQKMVLNVGHDHKRERGNYSIKISQKMAAY